MLSLELKEVRRSLVLEQFGSGLDFPKITCQSNAADCPVSLMRLSLIAFFFRFDCSAFIGETPLPFCFSGMI